MNKDCQLVIFSDKAYNAIIRETFEWDPVETGGILLGHILDNGCWLVMEVLPPGYGEGREGDNVHHEYAYFEYNRRFVNYLAKSVAEQYEIPLELLGLWHRHPGSMNVFSGTDDVTNKTFASQNTKGAISGLINVDPQLRMTMYHVPHKEAYIPGRPAYDVVEVEVICSEDIPEDYRKFRYYDGTEQSLHPYAPKKSYSTKNNQKGSIGKSKQPTYSQPDYQQATRLPHLTSWLINLKKNNKLIILIVAIVCFLVSLIPLSRNIERVSNLFVKNKTQKNEAVESKYNLLDENASLGIEPRSESEPKE